jgi:Fic family protein
LAAEVVALNWEGRTVEAVVPPAVADLVLPGDEAVGRAAERAAAAIRRMGERSTGPLEASARLLLRAEGLASSAIEGLRVGPEELALASARPALAEGVVGDVAGNLAVLTEVLEVPGPLTPDDLLAWHARLLAGSVLPHEHIGRWRDRIGWVGGATPLVAAHVAAPPGEVPRLMADLVAFVNRHDVDPVVAAAVAHAQFETIHPFADGNGRIGRALVGWVLVHRLGVPVPPPVSVAIARDIGGYLAGLTLYRQSDLARWLTWFSATVERSADLTSAVLDEVTALLDEWRGRVGDLRADATARRLVDDLPVHPALTATLVRDLHGVSEQAGRTALVELAERGILVPVAAPASGPGRRPHWYVAHDLLTLLGG